MGWIVFLSVAVFFAFLLIAPIRIYLKYDGELKLCAGYLFFKFRLVPAPEKKLDLNAYTLKKKRMKRKAPAKEDREKEKKEKKSGIFETLDLKGRPLTETVAKVLDIALYFAKKFFRSLTVKISTLRISVATGDAAKTAVAYGAVSQTLSYALNILRNISNLKIPESADLSARADFCGEKSEFRADILMTVKPVSVISLAIGSIFKIYINFLKDGKRTEIKENGGEQNV